MIDDLTALRLQLDWGVDDALGDVPVDRLLPPRAFPVRGAAEPTRLVPAEAAPAAPAIPVATTAWHQADTLDALHRMLDSFSACPLRATATHTVRPSGDASAPVVLIAEAPDGDDDRSGHAFSGAAGATLDRVMAPLGLRREYMLLTTLVPWRPPGNRPPSDSEVQACLPALRQLLTLVRPRAVVLVGGCPTTTLTGQAGTIRQLRGRWLEISLPKAQTKLPALPVLPLAQWLRDAQSKQQLWSDLLHLHNAVASV